MKQHIKPCNCKTCQNALEKAVQSERERLVELTDKVLKEYPIYPKGWKEEVLNLIKGERE